MNELRPHFSITFCQVHHHTELQPGPGEVNRAARAICRSFIEVRLTGSFPRQDVRYSAWLLSAADWHHMNLPVPDANFITPSNFSHLPCYGPPAPLTDRVSGVEKS
ncbi:hypothetical protein BaRGS_00009806 [Batillaria attramentaria]|uniref:Uncharacterized protein n=1 Tax=Batillaria attramentaria TaxID=370345 RepID=A0ABD0LI37_9CAEN